MFIEPIKCKQCGRTGRPGEEGFQSSVDAKGLVVHCQCGESITLRCDEARDQQMLSMNPFTRLCVASNHFQFGNERISIGKVHEVTFNKPFDVVCRAFLTPNALVAVKEAYINCKSLVILSSLLPGNLTITDPVEVYWCVYGLVDVDDLPVWYVHFYGALTHLENGLYKPALIDYAVAFESFIETFLLDRLAKRVGKKVAEYLLRHTNRIEDRVKDLLELAIGIRLSSCNDVYQSWDEDVRKLRNSLAHGDRITINIDAAYRAHAASYQAIRWIQEQDRLKTISNGTNEASRLG